MPDTVLPLQDITRQIAQHESQLELLRRKYETRQARLAELARHQEELQGQQEVKRFANPHRSNQRGRPPRVPKDFDGAVSRQQQSAEEWDRRYTRVWCKKDRSLVTQAAKLVRPQVLILG